MRNKISFNAKLPLFVNDFKKEFMSNIKNTIDNNDILYEFSTEHTDILVYKINNAEICISNANFSVEFPDGPNNINVKEYIDVLLCEYNKLKDIYKYLDTLYEFNIYVPNDYYDKIRSQLIKLDCLFDESGIRNEEGIYFKVYSHVKFY